VEQAGPVPGEVVTVGALVSRVLGDPALAVALGVRHGGEPTASVALLRLRQQQPLEQPRRVGCRSAGA
jgi:hypothetical protein